MGFILVITAVSVNMSRCNWYESCCQCRLRCWQICCCWNLWKHFCWSEYTFMIDYSSVVGDDKEVELDADDEDDPDNDIGVGKYEKIKLMWILMTV